MTDTTKEEKHVQSQRVVTGRMNQCPGCGGLGFVLEVAGDSLIFHYPYDPCGGCEDGKVLAE